MAGFIIQGFTQTREVRGGNKLVKVREYHVIALPSETYFQFRRTATQPCYGEPKPCAQQFADRIEDVLAIPTVTDVVYSQDTTAGGRLEDMMTTFYATADGAIEGSVEQELKNFGPNVTGADIASAIAAAAGLVGS